jgi:hypothetical protein
MTFCTMTSRTPRFRAAAIAVPLCWLLGAASVVSSLACPSRESAQAAPPPKPSSVPQGAVWSGGADGGVFILLRASKTPQTYRAEVYDDHAGSLLFRGELALEPPGTTDFDPKDAASYSGWDGDTLHLTGGRRLVEARGKN